MAIWAFGFLMCSVVAFWLSTQQSGLLNRLPIWLAGLGFMVVAGWIVTQIGGRDIVREALMDAWANRDDPTDGMLFNALVSNAPTVQRYVAPLLNLLLFFSAILAVLALVALTPGEAVEKFTRPIAIGMIGAVVGAGVALGMVAIAFGGPVELEQYVGRGDAGQVSDGDTFFVGDVSVRLLDVDAPELRQPCRAKVGDAPTCGALAKDQLARLIDKRIISCTPQDNVDGKTRRSYGRPLVRCIVRDGDGNDFDLARRMVETGFAVPTPAEDGRASLYASEGNIAQSVKAGLLQYCWLKPDAWRNDAAARSAFDKGESPANLTAGDCAAL